MTIRELKVKPDGTVADYELELLHRTAGLVVARFAIPGGVPPGRLPFTAPPGSRSDGYFWAGRPYVLYRFRGPAGEVLAHRFDAAWDVDLRAGEVTYRDLVLDWWVLPDGRLLEEDRDQLASLLAEGVLTAVDEQRARRAARAVVSRYRHILDEVGELERRLGY
jgi:hypothetical protein